jgi:hypothetical protein
MGHTCKSLISDIRARGSAEIRFDWYKRKYWSWGCRDNPSPKLSYRRFALQLQLELMVDDILLTFRIRAIDSRHAHAICIDIDALMKRRRPRKCRRLGARQHTHAHIDNTAGRYVRAPTRSKETLQQQALVQVSPALRTSHG